MKYNTKNLHFHPEFHTIPMLPCKNIITVVNFTLWEERSRYIANKTNENTKLYYALNNTKLWKRDININDVCLGNIKEAGGKHERDRNEISKENKMENEVDKSKE